MERTNAEKIAH
jgi:hypothetical protein